MNSDDEGTYSFTPRLFAAAGPPGFVVADIPATGILLEGRAARNIIGGPNVPIRAPLGLDSSAGRIVLLEGDDWGFTKTARHNQLRDAENRRYDVSSRSDD